MDRSYSGLLAILLYCLSAGLSGIWVFFDLSHTAVNIWALAFVIFLVASLFFWVAQVMQGISLFRLIRTCPKTVLKLNILTLITWIAMFAAILIAEASFESAVCQAWVPITVLTCDVFAHQARWKSLRTVGVLCIAVSLLMLVVVRVLSDECLISFNHLRQGIVLATLAGLASGLYMFQSARLHHAIGCTILDVLSTRFILLLIVTAVLGREDIMHLLANDGMLIGQLVLLAIFSVILPALTFQHALAKLGDARVSLITPLVPVLSLIAELVLGHWQGMTIPILITITCVAVCFANLSLQQSKSTAMRCKYVLNDAECDNAK
ncbi:MAG: EamA family transporter [Neisseriales bacterium]|nr:MAG: EamA family transporter [Neisseriales bacterium]